MEQRSRRNTLLDAWRGISVILVIVGHASARIAGFESSAFAALAPIATIGVQFFFVISGYIITHLLIREALATGRISLRAFYVRRCCRILPPLTLLLATVWVLDASNVIRVERLDLVRSAFFLCNTHFCGWFLAHTWSLAIEEQFYLVWPTLLALAGLQRASILSATAGVVFLAVAQAGMLFGGGVNNGLNVACIAAGALYGSSDKARLAVGRLTHPLVLFAAGVLLFGRPAIPLMFPGQYRLQDLASPLLIALVLFGTFRYREFLERTRAVRGFAAVGVISYGLYLWQQLFLAPASYYGAMDVGMLWPFLPLVVFASWRLVERPFIRAGVDFSRRLAPTRFAATA